MPPKGKAPKKKGKDSKKPQADLADLDGEERGGLASPTSPGQASSEGKKETIFYGMPSPVRRPPADGGGAASPPAGGADDPGVGVGDAGAIGEIEWALQTELWRSFEGRRAHSPEPEPEPAPAGAAAAGASAPPAAKKRRRGAPGPAAFAPSAAEVDACYALLEDPRARAVTPRSLAEASRALGGGLGGEAAAAMLRHAAAGVLGHPPYAGAGLALPDFRRLVEHYRVEPRPAGGGAARAKA